MSQAAKFTCQCTRCDASGKYDRGTCFDCKGTGRVSRTNTRGLTPFVLNVIFENGSTNAPRIFANSREKAVTIVKRECAVKGWVATVN